MLQSISPKILKAGIFTSAFPFFLLFLFFCQENDQIYEFFPGSRRVSNLSICLFIIFLFACHATVVVAVTGFGLKRPSVATVCLEVGTSAVREAPSFLSGVLHRHSQLPRKWSKLKFRSSSEVGDGSSAIDISAIFRYAKRTCTAWDSEIESLTSRNPSLIELDRRKTRRRHRVTAALAPRKSCFLPCNANLHASSASLKHGLSPPSFFEWSSFLAHRLVVITHAIVKLRCKKGTVESWQQST